MNNTKTLVTQYIADLHNLIDALPQDDLLAVIDALMTARQEERTIFVCGNGGSAATASHMVADVSKNTRRPDKPRLRLVGLGDNIPTLTAYANDEGYDRVFAEPILSLMRPDDLLIAISGSGNSPNVLRGAEAAKEKGGKVIGIIGFEGGKLKALSDLSLVVPSTNMEMIEDLHMIVNHIITMCMREA